ncbi:MAG: hypothetical protein Q8K32_34220 [Archangium sp.]|nr:hypothetical protein [Archangium sp.]
MKTTLRLFGLLALSLSGCTNSLVDEVPRLYACDRLEGLNACPGGWRCGLSGYCLNPGQALPYACESSADCSTTWHCGTERVCYDRAAAQDRSCRTAAEAIPDAGDCAPGWRCGREVRGQVCHPLDAGAAYLCVSDSDCEATWRCGPEGACVDVAAQGLQAGSVSFTMAKVSPLLPPEIELLQVSVTRADLTFSFPNNRMIFTADGGLFVVTNTASYAGPTFSSSRESTPLVRPPHALVEFSNHLLVSDSSGIVDYRDAFDGGAAALVFAGLANAEFRYAVGASSAFPQEELAAFSGTTVGLCGRDSTSITQCDPSVFQVATLPATVADVAFVDADSLGRRSALAATSAGPWFAPRQGSSYLALDGGLVAAPVWRRMALPGLSDACSATPTPLDRLSYESDKRLLTAITDQDRRLSVFKRPYTEPNKAPCDSLAFDPEYGPCAACGPGEVLLKTGIESLNTLNSAVLALCQRTAADGGASVVGYRHLSFDGGCSLDPVSLPLSVSRGYQVSAQTEGLQGLDEVGIPRRCPLPGCETMLSATAPDRVAGGPGLLGTYNDDVIDESAQFRTPPSGLSSPLGMRLANFSNLYIAGSVTENPDWMISSTGRQGTQGGQTLAVQPMLRKLSSMPGDPVLPHAVFARSDDLLPSSVGGMLIDASGTRAFSTIATDAEGLPWLIVGAGDRIWATDSRLLASDAGVPSIGIKAVPLPSADIQSLAFAAFDRGDAGTGPLLDGYTVEQQRLFRVVVHSPTLWLTDELRLGETTAVAVAVWMEGKRGRVGTSDGRVFGLPVPVPISPPIPEAPLPTVLNYGSLCGQAFALSASALYQLSLETPPLGTWKRVSLEAASPGLDGFGAHWAAAMHKARVGNTEHLYLFSQTGLAIELVATCP